MNYIDRLDAQLEGYRPETIEFMHRACRVGRVSAETALELLQVLELDRIATDAEMAGMEAPEWYAEYDGSADMDRVFMPGEIGSVPAQPTRLGQTLDF